MASPAVVSGLVKANKSAGCYFNVTTSNGQAVSTNIPKGVADVLFGADGAAILAYVAKQWQSIAAAAKEPVAA